MSPNKSTLLNLIDGLRRSQMINIFQGIGVDSHGGTDNNNQAPTF